MSEPAHRRIIVAITGSIAAYKACELVRDLVTRGADVQVVMTESAKRFVAPMTLASLSGHPVRDSLWEESAELAMGHIELARWAQAIVIAPASADTLARLAGGRADDLLSTLCLASSAPIVVAPAMNHVMWAHPATVANMDRLAARGVQRVGPGVGELAERETGVGRMSEPAAIANAVGALLECVDGRLATHHVVVTAGPTVEPIDPVRFISNHSSGRMGYALASACAAAGATVTLISGPTRLDAPVGVSRVRVETAAEMADAVSSAIDAASIFIGAAAVADYRPLAAQPEKIKKQTGDATIELTRTRDIIAEVARDHPAVFTLGFAAETDGNLGRAARAKRQAKNLSMVAANRVGPDHAFGRDDNALTVVWSAGERDLGQAPKAELARQLVALIAERLAAPD